MNIAGRRRRGGGGEEWTEDGRKVWRGWGATNGRGDRTVFYSDYVALLTMHKGNKRRGVRRRARRADNSSRDNWNKDCRDGMFSANMAVGRGKTRIYTFCFKISSQEVAESVTANFLQK